MMKAKDPSKPRKVRAKLAAGAPLATQPAPERMRGDFLKLGASLLELPLFFASVSSVKANFRPIDATRLLVACRFPQILVSAYDIYQGSARERDEFFDELRVARTAGTRVLLDSGNYESYWLRDGEWSPSRYHEILEECPCDLAFSFDKRRRDGKAKQASTIIREARRDAIHTGAALCPIVHVDRSGDAPDLVVAVAEGLLPAVVAIPERELGDGVLERAGTIAAIRLALDEARLFIPIHVLGTGNPLSLLLFSAAGASTFDGLEWCQTIVDNETALLYHFQQFDFFRHQRGLSRSDGLEFGMAALIHNLEFFRGWMPMVRTILAGSGLHEVPRGIATTIRNHLPKQIVETPNGTGE